MEVTRVLEYNKPGPVMMPISKVEEVGGDRRDMDVIWSWRPRGDREGSVIMGDLRTRYQ